MASRRRSAPVSATSSWIWAKLEEERRDEEKGVKRAEEKGVKRAEEKRGERARLEERTKREKRKYPCVKSTHLFPLAVGCV
jgi:hypothetical protein